MTRPRALADRCPGLLRPHVADDGLLVRLRLPGGQITATVLTALSNLAAEVGEGSLQLTSRGNLQLRGLRQDRLPGLVDRVADLGLLPSVSHERVRNVVASPLSGLTPGSVDLRPLVRDLDWALCATPELAELPGRFLFALDDGRGDVSSLRFDLAYLAQSPTAGTVLVGGTTKAVATEMSNAVELMLSLAVRFVRLRTALNPPAWHLDELADVGALDPRILTVAPGVPAPTSLSLGDVAGSASVGVPLSLLDPRQVREIDRAAAGGPIVLTPWRGVVIPGAAAALPALAGVGLIVDESSAWSQLTACIGAPGCARSAISTRQLATELVVALGRPPALPVHISGCSRRCGAPSARHVDLMAPASVSEALAGIERST